MKLVLASSSPRRRHLLETLGLAFEVQAADVDETRLPDEPPAVYVERVAVAKATAIAAPERITLGADTTVVHEARILGKPSHPEEARSMLRRLQGDRHEVFTGVAAASWDDGPVVHSAVDVTEVHLSPMTGSEIDDYVSTGEPMGKAGAYALQGAGGRFVEAVKGSPFTVIGLPLHLIARLLAHAGADIGDFELRARS